MLVVQKEKLKAERRLGERRRWKKVCSESILCDLTQQDMSMDPERENATCLPVEILLLWTSQRKRSKAILRGPWEGKELRDLIFNLQLCTQCDVATHTPLKLSCPVKATIQDNLEWEVF